MEYPNKILEIIFLVDSSSNMSGSKIGTVNTAIEELVSEIQEIAYMRNNCAINIHCLSYSNGSKWHCLEHIPIQTFRWEYLKASGRCDLGSGLLRLNKFLKESNFSVDTHYRPIIFLFNSSKPTDNIKYAIFKLGDTEWFRRALKVGVVTGSDVDKNILQQFTGNKRNIITQINLENLRKWIQFFETR